MPLRYSFTRLPRCGKCRARLPEKIGLKIARFKNRWRTQILILIYLSIFIGAGAGLWAVEAEKKAAPPRLSELLSELRKIQPDHCIGRPQPRQGIYQSYVPFPSIAMLTIKTAPAANYFVKLADAATGDPAITIFVTGGSTVTEYVPLGEFVLKFATGKSWCSEDELFGTETGISVADDKFVFDQNSPAWIVELIHQRGGNLRTHAISRHEF
jgi:hypothetical protein